MSSGTATLGSVCDVLNGYAFKSEEYVSCGIRVIRITNVQKGQIQDGDPKFIDPDRAKEFERFLLSEGDILISLTGNVGRVGVLTQAMLPAALNQRVGALKLRSEKVDARYLFHILNSDAFEREAIKNSNGVAQLNLSSKWVEKHEFPLPSLAEQKRIAGILDAADALRAKRRDALAQLDILLQATFLDLFGDPVGNGWKMVTVEEVAKQENGSIRTGPFGSQLLHSEFVEEGIHVLGIDNASANEFRAGEPRFITTKKYEELRRYTVKPGDVLITIMGTCGRCAIVPEDVGEAINTKHLCCITLDQSKCLPAFMHAYFLQHPTAKQYLVSNAKGAIMSGLNMGIIKRLPIPIPPLKLQQHYASVVSSIGRQMAAHRTHLAELDTLFASLQSRAFRGEL